MKSLALLLIAVALTASCEKVPLTSPTGSTITLTVDKASVAIGGTVALTAVVTEAAGTAPQNGTMVTFVAPLGTVTPQEAATVGGVARATYTATASGTAKVSAFSGAAKATEVELRVGGAAAERITVRTEPATVPQAGGTVTVIANVQDLAGSSLPSTPVNFTTDNGTLSSNAGVTDANGEARVTLTTSRATKVSANVGTKTAEFTVAVVQAPTVTVTGCTTPTVGLSTTCTITPTVPSGGSPIASVVVNWGDGSPEVNLGSVTGPTSTSHVYSRPDTFTVTATATDLSGQRGTGTASVVVTRSIPPISISGPPTGTVGSSVTFTVTPPTSSAGVPTSNVTVDFGDGTTRNLGAITAATSVAKTYGAAGNYIVAATVTDTAGTRNTSSTGILISGSPGPTVQLAQSGTISGGCGTFTVTLTPASGTTIQSGSVKLDRTGADLYIGTTTATFTPCGLLVNDVLTARYTDSTGVTNLAQALVK